MLWHHWTVIVGCDVPGIVGNALQRHSVAIHLVDEVEAEDVVDAIAL